MSLNSSFVDSDTPGYYSVQLTQPWAVGISIAFSALFLPTTILYWWKSGKERDLAQRCRGLTTMGGVLNTISSLVLGLYMGCFPTLPCYVGFLGLYLGFLPLLLTIMFRSLRVYVLHRENIQKFHPAIPEIDSTTTTTSSISMDFSLMSQSLPTTPLRKPPTQRRLTLVFWILFGASYLGAILTQLLTHTGGGITMFPSPSYKCSSQDNYFIYIITGIYLFGFSPIMLFLLWRVRDAFNIRNELIWTMVMGIPTFITFIVWKTVFKSVHWEKDCYNTCLYPLLIMLAVQIGSIIIPLWKLYRYPTVKVDHAGFWKLLDDPEKFDLLAEFAIKDFSAENTRFIKEYQYIKSKTLENFLQSQNPNSINEIQGPPRSSRKGYHKVATHDDHSLYGSFSRLFTPASMTIKQTLPPDFEFQAFPEQLIPVYSLFYHTFVSSDSALEVNLSAETRRELVNVTEAGEWTIDMFDKARKEVIDLIWLNTYPKFLLEPTPASSFRKTHKRQPSSPPKNNPTSKFDLELMEV